MRRVFFFDVGHTLAFPHPRFYPDLARALGGVASPEALWRAERDARFAYEEAVRERGTAQLWDVFFFRFFHTLHIPSLRWREGLDCVRHAHRQIAGLFHVVPREVIHVLETLHGAGYRMGVISNADTRLPHQLEFLGLARFFTWMVCSASVGIEKPDPRIFQHALEVAGVPPERMVYAGDYRWLDVEPARTLGIRAYLLDPKGFYPDHPYRIASLTELLHRELA